MLAVVAAVNVCQERLVPVVLAVVVTGVPLPMVLRVQLIPAVAVVVRAVTAHSAPEARAALAW